MERVFVGWDGPCLAKAVDWLANRYGTASELDLSRVTVGLPGSRARRRLLELLIDRSQRDGLRFRPPQLKTVGQLPEDLYHRKRPFACELVQKLAWVEALRAQPTERLEAIVSSVPDRDDLPGWLALAEMLARLHRELAAEGLDFAKVARHEAAVQRLQDSGRWERLAQVQERYLRTLDGLDLWDVQTARLFAIEHELCRSPHDIVLVGTVDLNQQQRMLLEQVSDRVTSLVFAPINMADRFDAWGCLLVAEWQGVAIDLDDSQIQVVGGPADQAAAVARTIAGFQGRYSADEIVVGIPDATLVPYLEQRFAACGLQGRTAVGRPVARSGPFRLLASIAEYLAGRRFAAMAALIRHPAMSDWLDGQGIEGDWLSEFDRYYSNHFPPALDGRWLGRPEACEGVRRVYESVERLLAALSGDGRPLSAWCEPILDILVQLYGSRPLEADDPVDQAIAAACQAFHDIASEYVAIDPQIVPTLGAAEALRLMLSEVASCTTPAATEREAIEFLGWLELPWDDAAALIITGMNEGIVPGSLNSDMFLPDQLRRALGVEDNERRYARDAYALSLLAASRKELTIIAGRRAAEGDPLIPSRLLFACDEETLVERVRRFFAGGEEEAAPAPTKLRAGQRRSIFIEPPRPAPLAAESDVSLRVTEFRDYLACPYRYYLRRCLGLEPLGDAAREIDGRAFGSIAHEVLRVFGESDMAASTQPEAIFGFLAEALNREVARQYGRQPLAVIRVQAEQLRLRLRAFAQWQANWTAQGWRVAYVEQDFSQQPALFEVDRRASWLRGRIDRIDVNLDSGRYVLFDYKTSEDAKSPEKAHFSASKGWVDLQLPLYRHLAATLGLKGELQVGYLCLPKDTGKVGHRLAGWTDEHFESADEAAREVIRGIRRGVYWPPARPAPQFNEDLAAICLDGQFISRLTDDLVEEDAQ